MEHAGLKRLESLDYLRGLMALAVLAFHYDKWTSGVWQAGSILGKLGVYAVEIFFIISGMALTHTYLHALHLRRGAWLDYARKRVLRIFPLLWLTTSVTLLLDDTPRPVSTLFLNYTGLFGFWDASRDIATGAWSIGVELVFYGLFPLLLWWGENSKARFLAFWVLALVLTFGRAFWPPFYPSGQAQLVWWPDYTQWIWHVSFFVTGMALAIFRPVLRSIPPAYWRSAGLAAALVLIALPLTGDPSNLVSAWHRLELSGLAMMLTAGWCLGFERFKGAWHHPFAWLGAVSYSLYLWHPLTYRAAKALNERYFDLTLPWVAAWAFFFTLGLSHLSYYYFEKPLMRKRF